MLSEIDPKNKLLKLDSWHIKKEIITRKHGFIKNK